MLPCSVLQTLPLLPPSPITTNKREKNVPSRVPLQGPLFGLLPVLARPGIWGDSWHDLSHRYCWSWGFPRLVTTPMMWPTLIRMRWNWDGCYSTLPSCPGWLCTSWLLPTTNRHEGCFSVVSLTSGRLLASWPSGTGCCSPPTTVGTGAVGGSAAQLGAPPPPGTSAAGQWEGGASLEVAL